MTPAGFIAKWSKSTLSERSACQQHFLDLCDLLGQAKPAAADPDGAWYTFERGVKTTDDDQGWADVWMKDRFAWEYKGKHKDLAAAYKQLLKYREALDNPPLLVVCDMDRFQVHTNFTGTRKVVHEFDLDSLAEPANLDILRKLFTWLPRNSTDKPRTCPECKSANWGQAEGVRTPKEISGTDQVSLRGALVVLRSQSRFAIPSFHIPANHRLAIMLMLSLRYHSICIQGIPLHKLLSHHLV
jgi:hypothetical protein